MPPVKTVEQGMTLDPSQRLGLSACPPAEWLPRTILASQGRTWGTPLGTSDRTVAARVDAGRWIAECVCGHPSWVTPSDPRLWCTECENAAVSGRWLSVAFPDEATRLEAERVLSVRIPKDQFWFPDRETVADLMSENVGKLDLSPFEGW